MFIRRHLSGGLAIAAALLAVTPAAGACAAPAEQSAPTVLARGLVNPRGITVGSDGNIYVAEAGSGGDQVVKTGEGDQATETRLGNTGRVTKITPGGAQTVVVGNLPSASSPEGEVVGQEGVVYNNGALWVTTTGAAAGLTQRPNEGALLRIDASTGAVTSVANLQGYENSNNPGGFMPDSDPYGLALGRDGMLYAADAAANVLYKIDPSNGQIGVAAVFPGIPLPPELAGQGPFAQGNPERNGAQESDPVPTGVTIAPDGSVYVGLLSGFPFLTGAASVQRVGADNKPAAASTGHTMVTGVAFGPDGLLYVSEFSQFDLTGDVPGFTPQSGRVVRVMSDGTQQVVAANLDATNGLAFDGSGNLYVVVNSISATDGQVLRIANATYVVTQTVGMPRTGQGLSLDLPVYLSLLLIVVGCALVVSSRRLATRHISDK